MRDRALADALRRLAADAAATLSAQIAAGEQIPFDVAEDSGENALFYRYVPLTSRFVRDRAEELELLPSFRAAADAVATTDVAASWLDAHGEPIPADPAARAGTMLTSFLARLWDGCTELSLDRPRLERALRGLDALTRDLTQTDLLVTPLVGLRMAPARLDLPGGVRIARAADVDTPPEARRTAGMNRRPWETQFVALAEIDDDAEGPFAALGQLRGLVSVLRLFKQGGVGLAPFAYSPTGDSEWQRFATGALPPRTGGYELTAAEAAELRSLAERLEARPLPQGPLAWALGRFEMGCCREEALEGLSDHVLALRALLGGPGHVGASLPVRLAALTAEGGRREEVGDRVQRVLALEAGVPARWPQGAADRGAALGDALWLEDTLRGVLREAALGLHGEDLGAACDEVLVASGLQAGELRPAPQAEDTDWPDPTHREEEQEMSNRDKTPGADAPADDEDGITRVLEPIPFDEAEITITPRARAEDPGRAERDDLLEEYEDLNRAIPETRRRSETFGGAGADWLSESSPTGGETLEWPAPQTRRPEEGREPIDSPRVRHLFPVPETSQDWTVPELDYRRRSSGGP